MRRLIPFLCLLLLAACTVETAVEPTTTVTPALRADTASVAEVAVPLTATIVAAVVEPTAAYSII